MDKFVETIQNIINSLDLHKQGMKELSQDKLINSLDQIISHLQSHKANIINYFDNSNLVMTDFAELHNILLTDQWPVAVPPLSIGYTEEDKLNRASGILDIMISEDLENKRFLDFGCGEGHVAYLAADEGVTVSVGYDIAAQNWENLTPAKPNNYLTTSFDEVKSRGPYDIILVNDVIDHTDQDVVGILTNLKNVLTDNGHLVIKCHPFTSRHATHLYKDLNKAYMHLVFTEQELEKIFNGKKGIYNRRIVRPLMTYKDFFEKAGFKVIEERITPKSQVEAFFKTPTIANRIMKNIGFDSFPEFQMSMDFIDFFLQKK